MGVQVRMVVHAPNEEGAAAAASAAFAEIERLDRVFSDYRGDSELSTLRRSDGRRTVSRELATVLVRAHDLARLSGGAFDVTVRPLSVLWRHAIARGTLPDAAAIVAARERTGFDLVRVDEHAGTVELLHPDVEIDLGGIAKGYVRDRAVAVLAGHDVPAALVEAGGDIVLGAAPDGTEGWAIEVPHLGCRIMLSKAAISTSGDAHQFVEVSGKRYSHVVDPRTGLGLTHGRTVTVVAPDGLTADGLATALAVAGQEEAGALLVAYPGARVLASEGGSHLCGVRDSLPKN